MSKLFIVWAAAVALALAASGCATAPAVSQSDYKPPTVDLDRVEVASYFAWPAPAPAPTVGAGTPTPTPAPPAFPAFSVPLVLDYVFRVTNPNPFTVTLDNLKYTAELEGAPNVTFPVNTPILKDRILIPANSAQPVRLTVVLDSTIVRTNLLVTSGAKLASNNLNASTLVEKWWKDIGDFKFKVRASQGTAEFKSDKGGSVVPFDATFPK